MSYSRSLHDAIPYSKRLVKAMRFPPGELRLEGGVDEFFLDHPTAYPWNDQDVGCLPMIKGGGRALVRMQILADKIRVDFSLIETTGGEALQRRAENAMAHAIQKYELQPYRSSRKGYGTKPGGESFTIYARSDPGPHRHRTWFWYNLSECPKELVVHG